jgi:hypothetical protein
MSKLSGLPEKIMNDQFETIADQTSSSETGPSTEFAEAKQEPAETTNQNIEPSAATESQIESQIEAHTQADEAIAPNEPTGPNAPAEDSGEPGINKEEAVRPPKKADKIPKWLNELNRFHHDVNGILATKENLKLVSMDKNIKPSFARAWKQDVNRYFQLIVNLRRRATGAKIGGKNVA